MKCRSCGSTVQFVKEWNYSNNYFYVKLYRCQNCGLSFKAYYHKGDLSHTIPKDAFIPDRGYKIRKQVLKFLRRHRGAVTCDEIAKILNLNFEDVLTALNRLEKDGVVEKWGIT